MKSNRSRDTSPELRLRSELHGRGRRYKVHRRMRVDGLTVCPDLLFTREQVAVYVDGCFWHGCPEHGTRPKANRSYWDRKLAANRARDDRATAALEGAGWRVIRIWEHVPASEGADRVEQALLRADSAEASPP